MEKLNKRWTTVLAVAAIALSVMWTVSFFCQPPINRLKDDINRQEKILMEDKALLAEKSAIESEWENKKNFFNQGLEAEAVQNIWVKDLLTFAQSQSLTLEKLEPAGIKTAPDGKHLTVFLSFQGDIRKFVGLIYELVEKDPLSRVESFDVRREEGSDILSFELMLEKVVR